MPHFEKHFTVQEANALLPELREVLVRVREMRDRLVVDWQKAVPVLRMAPMNGGGQEAGAYLTDLNDLNRELKRLTQAGVLLKDVDRGLVDFPAWREEREVFLCWHLEEDAVRYWHELDTGFGGRRALE